MRVRKLTSTFDYAFGNSQDDFLVNSPAAVAQIVNTSLLLFLAEWYLDTTQGMPWLEGVIGKHNQATADATVQDFILGVQDVTGIGSFVSVDTQSNRLYAASADIDTAFGPTSIDITNEQDF